MKKSFLLAAVACFAISAFAQDKDPHHAPGRISALAQQTAPNFHFHARLFTQCCSPAGFPQFSAGDQDTSPTPAIDYVQGEPDWMPSTFMNFRRAVSIGRQQQALKPSGQQPDSGTIQQILDSIELQRTAAWLAQHPNGSNHSAATNAATPAQQPSPDSTYMDFSQALALGKQEIAEQEAAAQPPPLGDVAREEAESKPAGEKATVKIKQDAYGNPIIIQKKQQP
jgi:hypothetical protein